MHILDTKKNTKEEIIKQTIQVLSDGGMIIYPTETCYGIAVDATNQQALNKLLQYKKFKKSVPISVAMSDIQMANKYVDINETAKNIYTNYLPGPITVISMDKGLLKPPTVSKQGTVGVRIPDFELTREIIKQYDKPITATSANVSYRNTPYDIPTLLKNLPAKSSDMIDLVIDAGVLPQNEKSTVLDTTMNSLQVLRKGMIQFEDSLSKENLLLQTQTDTPEQTEEQGYQFAKKYLKKQSVILLSGELGSGKTQLTKGIAKYMGVTDIVNSPTYTIFNEYTKDFVHMDTWRLMDNELHTSGLETYLSKGCTVVIEWADKFFDEILEMCKGYDVDIFKIKMEYISLEKRDIHVYR